MLEDTQQDVDAEILVSVLVGTCSSETSKYAVTRIAFNKDLERPEICAFTQSQNWICVLILRWTPPTRPNPPSYSADDLAIT